MAEERDQELKPNFKEIIAKDRGEYNFGPKNLILEPGTEIFLKDYKDEDISFIIPKDEKIHVLSLGKINIKDEKTHCTFIEFYKKNEEDEFIAHTDKLEINNVNLKDIGPGDKIWCETGQLKIMLELKQKEDLENKEKEEESKVNEPIIKGFSSERLERWKRNYRDPTLSKVSGE